MTPFFFIGFDVIPREEQQEEINVQQKISMIMVLSIVYDLHILCADHLGSVGYVMSPSDIYLHRGDQDLLQLMQWQKHSHNSIMSSVLIKRDRYKQTPAGGSRAMV